MELRAKWQFMDRSVTHKIVFFVGDIPVHKLPYDPQCYLLNVLDGQYFTHQSETIYINSPDGSMSQVVGLPNNSHKPITNKVWVRARLCILQNGWTRLSAASDKVYQLLAHGRWFSPASSTTKTGRHDIAEILLKVALNLKNQIKLNQCLIFLQRNCITMFE